MKTLSKFLKFSGMAMLSGMLLLACNSDDPEVDPEPVTPAPTGTVEELTVLSDRLKFYSSAQKKNGKAPATPAPEPSLKISFRDTLYLMEEVKFPIKFLHDTASDVAGAFIQVHAPGATNTLYAEYFYDVPELTETSKSDTTSVIFVSFDPTDVELPISFPVTITAYDKNGNSLGQAERIFTIEESFSTLPNSGRSEVSPCSFTTPPVGGWWQWEYSKIEVDGEIDFLSSPDVLIGGQTINGCCNEATGGGSGCVPGQNPNESLFFPTYYQIAGETFIFSSSGTFERITLELHGNPQPDKSNFCGVAYGIVENSIEFVTYEGNWILDQGTKNLRLQTTSSSGFGYGNAGGVLRYNCHSLRMTQRDPEGFGGDLEKVYFRVSSEDDNWFPID